jgi:basic membrane protein A
MIRQFETGYEGARAVNPNVKVVQNYVGVTDGAWNNRAGQGTRTVPDRSGSRRPLHRRRKLGPQPSMRSSNSDAMRTASEQFVIGVDSNQNMVKPGLFLPQWSNASITPFDVVKSKRRQI